MSTIVTRAGKGSSLTWDEMDANLTNLNNDKIETDGALGTPVSGTLTNCTGLPAAGVTGTALVSAAIGTTVQAYDANIATVAASQVEMEAGTEAALRSMSPLRIAQAITALSPASVSAASQSDQETATSNTVYVTPGRQQFHPSSPKAWIRFNGTGTPAIVSSYNVTSITDNGTGDYTITFTTAFSNTNYCLIATADSQIGSTNATRSVEIHTLSVGSVRIQTVNTAGGLEDMEYVSLVIFGDQ